MRSGALRRACLPCRALCLPLLSLTRTPGASHLEWCSAFWDPVFEMCEKSVWLIGLVCFVFVVVAVSTVVLTIYTIIVPFLWNTQHPLIFACYFVYGNYLFVNICFHYFKGVYTDPGSAPKVPNFDPSTAELRRGWRVCRKCEAPKPPRSHHCRICNRCILKMDHHCPWMFNCIGHNNHRYFMMFVVYMWLGTMFVVNICWSRVYVIMDIRSTMVNDIVDGIGLGGSVALAAEYPNPSHMGKMFLLLVFFVCVGVVGALSILGGWHFYLISVSETTIEFYTNKREAREMKKSGKVFVNPYHYGCLKNWIVFLGVVNGRSFLRHILLPSGHVPHHNGMDWKQEDVVCYKDKIKSIPV